MIEDKMNKILEKIAEDFNAGSIEITLTNKKTKKKKIWKLTKLN